MTNEALVATIQSGQRERWPELWQQVKGLAWRQIHRWSWAREKAGMEREDFLQVSLLALWTAVDSYDTGRGAQFSTWFVIELKKEFVRAAGIRTEKQSQDPLRGAVSLDAPLTDDDGDSLALADTLEDPKAEDPFRRAALSAALESVLSDLSGEQRHALYCRYWLEVPADSRAHNAALRALRHPSKSRALRELL